MWQIMRANGMRRRVGRGGMPILIAAAMATPLIAAALSPALTTAAEDGSPVIGHVSATEVGEHEVKLEAQVDPGGLETVYEIRLVWQLPDPPGGPPLDAGERPTGGAQTQTGTIAAASGDQAVTATLTELSWGYVYYYVIIAANSVGQTKGESPFQFGFHISGEFPNGEGTGPPYESETPIWYTKLSEEESKETLRKYEAEKYAKEQEEQKAKEARYLAEEAEMKRVEEEEAQEAAARERREEEAEHPACVVPALKGDTLAAARRALAKAHCRRGLLHRPASRKPRHGVWRVQRQGVRPGTHLRHRAPVALWIGRQGRRVKHA